MSAAERKAVVQECLDQAHWYRAWATQKHGLPTTPLRNIVADEPPRIIPIPYVSEKTAESAKESSTETLVTAAPNWRNRLLAGVLGATVLAGTGAAAGVAGWLANGGDKQPPAAALPPVVDAPATGDLLQWLNQEGYNVPPAATGVAP